MTKLEESEVDKHVLESSMLRKGSIGHNKLSHLLRVGCLWPVAFIHMNKKDFTDVLDYIKLDYYFDKSYLRLTADAKSKYYQKIMEQETHDDTRWIRNIE